MTFDEALNELEPRTIWSPEMRDLLEQLRATYAPVVEMTQQEADIFKSFVYAEDARFSVLLQEMNRFDGSRWQDLFESLSDEDVMFAWLHPESIKVIG